MRFLTAVLVLLVPVVSHAQGYARTSSVMGWSGTGSAINIYAEGSKVEVLISTKGAGAFHVFLTPERVEKIPLGPGVDTVGKVVDDHTVLVTDRKTGKVFTPIVYVSTLIPPQGVSVEVVGKDSTIAVSTKSVLVEGSRVANLAQIILIIRGKTEMVTCTVTASAINPKYSTGITVSCDK